MAENFVSRIIFENGFTETIAKFKRGTKEVVQATEDTGEAVDQASSKLGKMKGALAGIRGKHKAEVKAVGLGQVNKNVASIQSQLERMTNKPVSITAQAKLTRNDVKVARKEIKELQAQLKDLTGQKYDINLDVNGTQVQTLSGKLKGGMGTALSVAGGSLLAGGVGAAVMGIGSGISSAAGKMWTSGNERQQYLSTMTHFSGSEKKAQDMMKWANKNAAKTQFSSSEVLAAASRGVQVADGDVVQAKKLTALAEDMASLTPGKSIMDAMEALADAEHHIGVLSIVDWRFIPYCAKMVA